MDSLKAKVGQVISDIYHKNGEVRATDLIDAAKPKASIIHEAFEWDDKKAGHEYRLIQARSWIRKVEIVIENQPERFVHVPIIESGGSGRDGYYKPISVIAKNADEFAEAMKETLSSFNSAKKAYSDLKRASEKTKGKKLPNFKKADKGFKMIDSALAANG